MARAALLKGFGEFLGDLGGGVGQVADELPVGRGEEEDEDDVDEEEEEVPEYTLVQFCIGTQDKGRTSS